MINILISLKIALCFAVGGYDEHYMYLTKHVVEVRLNCLMIWNHQLKIKKKMVILMKNEKAQKL